MNSISVLFTGILSDCSEKENETGLSLSRFKTTVSFIYECYNQDKHCSLEQRSVELSNEQFESYLVDREVTEESCQTQLAWNIDNHLMSRRPPKQQHITVAQKLALQNILTQPMNETFGSFSRTLRHPHSELAEIVSDQLDVA
jgi:hypothetical protein